MMHNVQANVSGKESMSINMLHFPSTSPPTTTWRLRYNYKHISHHVNSSVEEMDDVEAAKLRSHFIQVLSSCRSAQGNSEMELGDVNVEISRKQSTVWELFGNYTKFQPKMYIVHHEHKHVALPIHITSNYHVQRVRYNYKHRSHHVNGSVEEMDDVEAAKLRSKFF
ncbi:hypothetical protein L1987_85829 [Smallanthus sonchifolius]|uniref:Uncharacterized protein n=1 Tax=Smallanthus sonchifolius TaxID=185202 RepID=A0ACB8XYB0_9ASTR|nr:hypothetical protein L1987_85829 [Smallanthus sonchifolius]